MKDLIIGMNDNMHERFRGIQKELGHTDDSQTFSFLLRLYVMKMNGKSDDDIYDFIESNISC